MVGYAGYALIAIGALFVVLPYLRPVLKRALEPEGETHEKPDDHVLCELLANAEHWAARGDRDVSEAFFASAKAIIESRERAAFPPQATITTTVNRSRPPG